MYSLNLYYHPLSVCSMKVRLALEEKGLEWTGRVMDIMQKQEQLDPWYLALNPKGVVPTLECHRITTDVITDSAQIIRFIASLPEGHSLLPSTDAQHQQMEKLIDLADTIDLQVMSYARHPSMEKSEEILDARIRKSLALAEEHPDLQPQYKTCAERSQYNKSFRVDPLHIEKMEQQVRSSMQLVEQLLTDKPFLLGGEYSLADVIWTVVLSRLDLLNYSELTEGNDFPRVTDYYQRVQRRESFKRAQIQNEWWSQ